MMHTLLKPSAEQIILFTTFDDELLLSNKEKNLITKMMTLTTYELQQIVIHLKEKLAAKMQDNSEIINIYNQRVDNLVDNFFYNVGSDIESLLNIKNANDLQISLQNIFALFLDYSSYDDLWDQSQKYYNLVRDSELCYVAPIEDWSFDIVNVVNLSDKSKIPSDVLDCFKSEYLKTAIDSVNNRTGTMDYRTIVFNSPHLKAKIELLLND